MRPCRPTTAASCAARHRRLAGCAGPALPLAQACRFAVSPPAAACAQRPSHATSTCFLCFPLPAVVAAALAYVMWGRYARTGKLMPAGMVAGLRCGGCRGRAERGLAVWRWLEDGVAAAPTQPLPAISCLLPPFPPPPTSPLAALSPHPTTHPLPCSAAMCVFYLWNLLLFSPTLPPAKAALIGSRPPQRWQRQHWQQPRSTADSDPAGGSNLLPASLCIASRLSGILQTKQNSNRRPQCVCKATPRPLLPPPSLPPLPLLPLRVVDSATPQSCVNHMLPGGTGAMHTRGSVAATPLAPPPLLHAACLACLPCPPPTTTRRASM